jgi:putative two-component system response regulator
MRAAPLHDIGKIGVPDAILLKTSPLTPEEYALMRAHTTIGAQILSGSEFGTLQTAEEIAASHHEHWDGTGYPLGLAGEDIPLAGRLVALADVFDALVHERPYKPAWPLERAVEEIRSLAGTHFDPDIVTAFDTLDHERLVDPIAPAPVPA